MNSGAGLGIEDCFYHVDINLICVIGSFKPSGLFPPALQK